MHWFWVCGIAAGILHIKCSTRQPTYNIIHIHSFNRLEMVFDSMRYSRYSGLNEIRCIFLQCYSWEPFREKYTSQCVNLNQPMWYHRQNGMAWRRWLAGCLYQLEIGIGIGNCFMTIVAATHRLTSVRSNADTVTEIIFEFHISNVLYYPPTIHQSAGVNSCSDAYC